MIYIAEIGSRAVAGIDAEDLEEARDFLRPAVEEMMCEMFNQEIDYRLDETAPMTTRAASPAEISLWLHVLADHNPA
jgi:hypothetical protein